MNIEAEGFVVRLVLAFGFFARQVRLTKSPSDTKTGRRPRPAIEPPVESRPPGPPHPHGSH